MDVINFDNVSDFALYVDAEVCCGLPFVISKKLGKRIR